MLQNRINISLTDSARPYWIGGVVVLGLILYFIFDHHDAHHDTHQAHRFEIVAPWRQSLDINKEYVAQIHSSQHIEFRAFETGYLQRIYVDEGQYVEQGQDLFQTMPQLLEAEYEKAKAEYDLSKIEFDNTQNLAEHSVVSPNELALVKARLDKAAAELKLAEAHLSLSKIKAPFGGIIDRFHVRIGSLIEEGELLTTLSDNRVMWVYFNVSESDYLDYVTHQNANDPVPVRLILANGALFDQVGKIDTIEADFNNETGNVAFRASFTNPKGLLRHGQTGTVVRTEHMENVLVIPQKATFEVLEKRFVYVVDHEGVLHAREIDIDKEVPNLFVVKSGLKEGETILLEGLGKVHNSMTITPHLISRDEVLSSLHLPIK